jgi:hypothetical protein
MSEKPFLIMVTHNRPKETMTTLQALEHATDFSEVDFVIVDNGSTGGLPMRMVEWANRLMRRVGRSSIEVLSLPKNIGCPRALNLALRKYRQPGQPVVKIDNDVMMVTKGWPYEIQNLIAEREALGRQVAMIGAWYDTVLHGRLLRTEGEHLGKLIHHVATIIGHTVWHTGKFMDAVGFFDVLHSDHIYGFEDLILSHKAGAIEWEMLVWEGWQIRNIQRSPSIGKVAQREHTDAMRPFYNERVAAISQGGTLKTGFDGKPQKSDDEGEK